MNRHKLFPISFLFTLVLAVFTFPVFSQVAPEITGSLSNFDVRNNDTVRYEDFELYLSGKLDPKCVTGHYPGWGAPPKIMSGTPFSRGGVSITWNDRRDSIAPGRVEHFGIKLECNARFDARGFWSIEGRPVREVPLPWQFWQTREGAIWDVIMLSKESEAGAVAIKREYVTLPRPIFLQQLDWDQIDGLVREFGQKWKRYERAAQPLEPGQRAVLKIPVNREIGAVVVRYTVSQKGRVITRFINEAVLAWPAGPFCFPNLPNPQLEVAGTEDYTGSDGNPYTRYHVPVLNRAAFSDALFTPAPDLPPCGANPNSARTWVDINDGEGDRLYGFCALSSAESLGNLWFARPRGEPPPECVSVTLNDRRCEQTYQSNCASTAGYGPECINFEEPPLGTTYLIGNSFTDSGASMTVDNFQWSNGTWTSGGYARISNAGDAGYVGQEVTINNVNLDFTFPTLPNAVSLNFGEYGGNLNIEINGDFRNFSDFADIHNAVIGGATVTVVNGFGNDQGTLRLNGDIHSFAIGGQELVIDHVCITAAPGIDADGTWILPYGVGGTRLDGIQPDGLTDYTDSISNLLMEDAPFGSRLGFRIGAANVIPTEGIAYYRLLYKQASAVDWIDFDEAVAVHYQLEAPAKPPVFPALVLGPNDFGGKNLYRFRPHAEDLPGLVPFDSDAGETVSWPSSGFLGDIYSGFLNTTAKHLAPGRYLIKLEIYNSSGEKVEPDPTTFRFVVPIGSEPDGTIITDDADPGDIVTGGFVFSLYIDNRITLAVIDEPMIGAVGAGDCGFLEYDPSVSEIDAPVDVSFHAVHPANRALLRFNIYRGPNRVELAKIDGAEVSALTTGTAGIFGTAYDGDGSGNFDRPFGRYELLNCCGQPCIEAAFSANLHVLAKSTNGWHRRINSLDSHAVRAFALTPQ